MEFAFKPQPLIHVLNSNIGLTKSSGYLFRVRVNDTGRIKYLAFDRTTGNGATSFGESSLSSLPPGDHWNWGFVARDAQGRFSIQSAEMRDLPSVPLWHRDKVDYSVLGDQQYQSDGSQLVRQRKSEVESFMFPGQHQKITVIMEWDPHHMGGVITETEVYKQIDGLGIGPKFLAHLTENGNRVIGYLQESLPPGSRFATVEDLKVCQDLLGKLHQLGIVLGLKGNDPNTTRRDFSITPSGEARITRFQNCRISNDPAEFAQEVEVLEEKLSALRPSDDEDVIVSESAMKAFEVIGNRDGGLHPDVWDEILLTGTTTVTSLDHRWMLYYLREKNGCANNPCPEREHRI